MAMRVALDTNRYTDLARDEADVKDIASRAQAIIMPFLTIAELRAGFAMGTVGRENERALRRFLARTDVVSLYPDPTTTVQYATVYRQLRLQGTPIPTNDMWIAALVLQHGLTLCSRDKHFDHLSQLPRV
jgi:tRNA(fMet)-specific endonuclease VapC